MARRLIDRNRAREARRQARILDQLTSQFRGRVAVEIAAAMRRMAEVWQHTHAVLVPPEFHGRLEAVYQQMAYAAVSAFGSRILNQGKDAGLVLEHKDFASTMHRIAMRYVQRESVRRRITNVTETTRSQVVSAVSKGYEDGLGIGEIARNISDIADDISRMRAETIARTETHGAANYGSDQAARELGLPLRREWLAAHDERTRDTHAAADGQIVGMDDPFLVGDAVLMYPGDPAGPPEEVINCFAPWSRIHKGGLKAVMFREYCGDLVELSVRGPINLTVTPNHPVLTDRGWIRAGDIKESDNLIQCGGADNLGVGIDPKIGDGYATAHELCDLAHALGSVMRPRNVVVNLHGESVPSKDIDIVPFKGELLEACDAARLQSFKNLRLSETDIAQGALLSRRMIELCHGLAPKEPDGLMSSSSTGEPLLARKEFGTHGITFPDARSRYAEVIKATVDLGSRDSDLLGYSIDRVSFANEPLDGGVIFDALGKVHLSNGFGCELAEVISARRFHYAGPVFNFESENGLVIAEGIISHNCRCTLGYIVDDGIDQWEPT